MEYPLVNKPSRDRIGVSNHMAEDKWNLGSHLSSISDQASSQAV